MRRFAAALLPLLLVSSPVSAGDCRWPGCGGGANEIRFRWGADPSQNNDGILCPWVSSAGNWPACAITNAGRTAHLIGEQQIRFKSLRCRNLGAVDTGDTYSLRIVYSISGDADDGSETLVGAALTWGAGTAANTERLTTDQTNALSGSNVWVHLRGNVTDANDTTNEAFACTALFDRAPPP